MKSIEKTLKELGATYEANKSSPGAYSVGEARLDMAYFLGADSWMTLTTEQRNFALTYFELGRQSERKHHERI